MDPINPEKLMVNSIIWLRNLQWPAMNFGSEYPGHLKAIKRPPPAGGPGSEVSFLKTIHSI